MNSTGEVYIADDYSNLIEKFNAKTQAISVIAGGGKTGAPGAVPMPGTSAKISPADLALDSQGNIYLGDIYTRQIEKVDAVSQQIVALTDYGATVPNPTPAPGTAAKILPRGVAVDNFGNVYIADSSNSLVEKFGTNAAFPPTAVGSSSASQIVYVQLTAGSAVSSIDVPSTQNGFASAVSFTCSGLPSGASCSFSPATVTPSGAAASTTLTVTTSTTSAAVHPNSNPLFPGAALAAALCFLGWKKRRRVQLFLLLAVSFIGLSLVTGCGGASSLSTSTNPPPPPVTSTVSVTGTSGAGSNALQNSATFSLTIN